jgi:hypothetical protein
LLHVPDLAGLSTNGGTDLLKTFFIGILLGLLAAAGVLYGYSVDQVREPSIVTVTPNGGNIETFHINVPMDRIMNGAPGQTNLLPAGLEWPTDEVLADVRAEMYKLRNARDTVIGVAVRASAKIGDENIIDWVLHLPARGSVFINMDVTPREGGYRLGEIGAGSREFEPLHGFVTERWVANNSVDEDAPVGHIELVATYVGESEPEDDEELVH